MVLCISPPLLKLEGCSPPGQKPLGGLAVVSRCFASLSGSQKLDDFFGGPIDDHQVGPHASEWAASALLPIPDLVDREAEKACEVLLGQMKLAPDCAYVDFRWHMKLRPLQLTTCERKRFVKSLRDLIECSFAHVIPLSCAL
jgi:hypothetical protein